MVKEVSPSLVVFDTFAGITDNDEDNSRDADNNISAFIEIVEVTVLVPTAIEEDEEVGIAIEEITERVVKVVGLYPPTMIRRTLKLLTDRGEITQSRTGKKMLYF